MTQETNVRVELPLEGIEAEVRVAFDRLLGPIAERVAAAARNSAAFADKTGKLRQSIKALPSRYEGGGWIVVASAPHAHLIEFGHAMVGKDGTVQGHAPAHPFLRPARDRIARDVIHEIRAMLGGAFDERG